MGQDARKAARNRHLQLSTVDLLNDWWRLEIEPPLPQAHEIYGRLSKTYNVRSAYERAQNRHDPFMSPHGLFRKLAPGNNHHAGEFLQRFGPLKLRMEQRVGLTRQVRVNLAEFWGMHLRFNLVATLWERFTLT